jgi:NADPH-dependent 2,4-dienoyl-CoA reductase/sulfur reductase-like enzyme
VQKFREGAVRAREAGFELIEIHGAHGYLVNQFLSGFSNVREDEYGGSVAARTRFAKDIVATIRRQLGDNFPLSFKISAEEFVPGGLTVDESIQILEILLRAGIDVVQVSAGNDATPEWISQPMFMKKACLADYAEKIRNKMGLPVMVVGRINDPMIADNIIETGKADLVCIGRGLLADPEMPRKAKEGRLEDIRTCIACNTCMESIFKRGRVECLVNPTLGREREMVFRPCETPKRIMVVGGGPGGLNVAWVAAKRGHDVHLFEKKAALGGQLILGTAVGYKREMLNLIEFQKKQIKKHKVKCHLNHEATANTIRAMDPDVVILATGSRPSLPPVKGVNMSHVVPFTHALNGNRPTRERTVVIGGGPTGCEVALHLAEQGCPVTLVEVLPKIGIRLESMTRKVLIEKLQEYQVEILTGCELSKIEKTGVVVIDRDDKERLIEAAKVVIATGATSDNKLCNQISSLGYETYQIGDCLEPRSAKVAIYEGAVLGRSI